MQVNQDGVDYVSSVAGGKAEVLLHPQDDNVVTCNTCGCQKSVESPRAQKVPGESDMVSRVGTSVYKGTLVAGLGKTVLGYILLYDSFSSYTTSTLLVRLG